jgi:hypothetical protein
MRTHQSALAGALITAALAVHGCMGPAPTPDSSVNPDSGLPPDANTDSGQPMTAITSQYQLRSDLRALWTEHVVWTRVFIISYVAGMPDTPVAVQRLMQNQADIGNAIRPFYGDKAANEFTVLLREHITQAAQVVAAAKVNDAGRLAQVRAAWNGNGDRIARFLAGANPNWGLADLQAMMQVHLDQTVTEASARISGDWAADVRTFDAIEAHALDMADVLSAGISAQFPVMVSLSSGLDARGEDLHRSMRRLWEEHVLWTRVFIMSSLGGLADTPAATERLLQNQIDIGNAMRRYYGDTAATQLTLLLREHVTQAAEVVAAAKAGDAVRFTLANAAWVDNADRIARFLAAANSNWSLAELQLLMRAHLDQTTSEVTARLTADFGADARAYDAIETHILHMADVLSVGIGKQFPHGPSPL